MLTIQSLHAAEWQFKPWLAVDGTYSDNISQAPNKEEDFVADISPGFSLNGEGRRFSLNVFYNLQYLNYARDVGSDRFNNRLQLLGNGEVAEDLFFIDLRSTVSQQNINNAGNTADNTLSVTGNITNVYTFGISPYLTHRFGSQAIGEARYGFDRVEYSEGSRSDSTTHSVLLDLKSGEAFQIFTWNTYYRGIEEDQDEGQNIRFQRVEASGAYNFNRKLAVIFGTGYEDNEFITFKTDDTTAITWLAGIRLTPNQRTLLEGGAQNRFFGVAPYLNLEYRSRRTALGLHYLEDVTTTNQVRSSTISIPLLDPFGDPISDPNTGQAVEIPVDTVSVQNEVLVRKRLDGTVALRGQRTDVGVTLWGEHRAFQISPNEDAYGLTAFINRRLSRPTSIRLWGNVWRSEFDSPSPDRTQWRVGLGLNRQFSKTFSGRIDISHSGRDSNDPSLNFNENRITVGVTKFF